LDNCYKSGDYDALYARYLKNAPQLVDQVKVIKARSYVDLCGGTGAVSKELLKRGVTDITLVDLNENMLKRAPSQIKKIVADAEDWKPERRYDVIFCRQAITYLNLDRLEKTLRYALKGDGIFVFNLFNMEGRNTTLSLDYKGYELQQRRYRELTFILFGKAYHFQHSDKDGLDLTVFRTYNVGDIKSHFKDWRIRIRIDPRAVYFVLKRRRS